MKTPKFARALFERPGGLGSLGRYAGVAIGLLVVFGTYFALADFYRLEGHMNADEGFYAVAARSAMEGKLPYRDFAYTQAPLLPYVNGAAMSLIGFGLDSQRLINVFWGALGLLVAIAVLFRRTGRFEPGLVAAWCVAASPQYASFMAMGKSYAAAGFFLMACFAAVLWGGPLYRRTVAYAVFGAVAAGCRLPLGIPIAVASIALFLECGTWRQRFAVFGMSVGIAGAMLLPFVLAAPEQFMFFNFEYHAALVFPRRSVEQFSELWRMAPAALLCILAAISGTVGLIRRHQIDSLVLVWGVGLIIVVSMIPSTAYGEHSIPVFLAGATAALAAMWGRGDAISPAPFRHVVWALPLITLFHPLPYLPGDNKMRGGNIEELAAAYGSAFGLVERAEPSPSQKVAYNVEAAGKYIRDNVPEGDLLVVLPIVAVEAGYPVFHGTEMGMFAAMGPADESRADLLNLTTLAKLSSALKSRKPVAVVKMRGNTNWNFQWQSPSLGPQPRALYSAFLASLSENYRSAFTSGEIEVMVPK